MLRKFLDGLTDERICFHVEYVKEPTDIDEEVYEVVNFLETRRLPGHKESRTPDRRPTRRAQQKWTDHRDDYKDYSQEESYDTEDSEYSGGRIARLPPKQRSKVIRHPKTEDKVSQDRKETSNQKSQEKTCKEEIEKITELIEGLEQRLQTIDGLTQNFQQGPKPNRNSRPKGQIGPIPVNMGQGSSNVQLKNPATHTERNGNLSQLGSLNTGNNNSFQCFKCGSLGHFARNCWFTGQMQLTMQPNNAMVINPNAAVILNLGVTTAETQMERNHRQTSWGRL